MLIFTPQFIGINQFREIDRVFKRVAEGVQAFDSVYEKVQMASNQTQKEKLEQV